MILKCPRDDQVLDNGEWESMTLFLKTGDSLLVWPRCAGPGTPHWVSVYWKGKIPTVRTGPIVATPPDKSYLPSHGLSPAPPPAKVRAIGSVPPMVIRKRT